MSEPPVPVGRFARLGQLLVRRPRLVAGAWIVVLLLSIPLAGRVGSVLDAQPALGPDSEPVQVSAIEAERFPGGDIGTTLLLLRDPVGVETWPSARDEALTDIRSLPGVASVVGLRDLGLPAGDERSSLAQITFDAPDLEGASSTIDAIRAFAATLAPIELALAGGAATGRELQELSERDARRGEAFGLPISLLVLLVAFGAVVASVVPLLVAAASITVTLAVMFLVGQAVPFAAYAQTIVTMLGLATGIDYALLMVNRFREELRAGRAPDDAAIVTTATAGKAMVMSGLTVVLALTALLVPPLPFIRSVGLATLITLLVTIGVALTALPPLLALLGSGVDRLRITRRPPGTRTRRFWRRRAEAIMRAPYRWMAPALLALLALAAPTLGMRIEDPGVRGLAPGTESRTVVDALERDGLGGLPTSVTVLVDTGDAGFFGARTPRAISTFVRELEALPDVGQVVSPFSAPGVPRLLLFQYYVDATLARSSDVARLAATTVGSDDRWVRLRVIPTGDLSLAAASDLNQAVQAAAHAADLPVRVGGATAFESVWTRALYGAFPWALAIVVFATFVLLGLGFRSLLIPLKAILLNALTVAAAYGAVTVVFQWGFGAGLLGLDGAIGFVDTSVPLFVFAMVFGLSMDYEVFLVSRIYENHVAGMDDERAVIEALASTGNVITSAAAVMLTVFSVFLFSDVVLIKMLGLALFVAVALDATVVRAMLVPAVMRLAGRANWWMPRPLARLAERIDLTH